MLEATILTGFVERGVRLTVPGHGIDRLRNARTRDLVGVISPGIVATGLDLLDPGVDLFRTGVGVIDLVEELGDELARDNIDRVVGALASV